MNLSKNARMKLFQQTTGWSTDKMRANKKAINDIVGDDITPEMFDDDFIKRIRNFGFSDEEILNLPTIDFVIKTEPLLHFDEDLLFFINEEDNAIEKVIINGVEYGINDYTPLTFAKTIYNQLKDKTYLYLSRDNTNPGNIVLKVNVMETNTSKSLSLIKSNGEVFLSIYEIDGDADIQLFLGIDRN